MQGGVMTFRYREKNPDGSFTVDFKYKSAFKDYCHYEFYWSCSSGNCGYDMSRTRGTVDTGRGMAWCQSETRMVRRVQSDKPFQLAETSCCWIYLTNGNSPGWSLQTSVDLGTRSDTSKPNSSPVTTIIPVIRVPRNCPSKLNLLAYDPDGDIVQCRYGQRGTRECVLCSQDAQFNLDQKRCTLSFSSVLNLGIYIFELALEDFPINNINLRYSDGTVSHKYRYHTQEETTQYTTSDDSDTDPTSFPPTMSVLSKIPLQFVLEVYSWTSSCDYGQYRPLFLPPTPNNRVTLHARVGTLFQVQLTAQAMLDSIVDFKISGPTGMHKWFKSTSAPNSKSMMVEWTPTEADVGDHVPLCFVAETTNGHQSEMRCVIIIVGPSKLLNTTLLCTSTGMIMSIAKSRTSALYENHLRLNNPQCLVTSNSTHLIARAAFNDCGTQIMETENKIIFKNQITSFDNMGDVITRTNQVVIAFNCSFPKTSSMFAAFRAQKAIYEFTEAGFGKFSYSFQFFQDSQFNAVHTQYPLEVLLRDIIYMEIQVVSVISNIQLFVESCKATPHDNPNDPVFYDIIKDGCQKDSTLVKYPGNNRVYRFGVEAFTFLGNYESVYVSCTVMLCKLGDPNTRCARGCVTSSQRGKRSLASETQQHYISQGPLRLKREVSSNRVLHSTLEPTTSPSQPTATKLMSTTSSAYTTQPTTSQPSSETTTDNLAISALSKISLQFVLESKCSYFPDIYKSNVPSPPYVDCPTQHPPVPTGNTDQCFSILLHARAQMPFQLHLLAQATMDSIVDFKISGPANMTKRFTTSGSV
ncbi:uncharacterized protein O3C94_021980 [Discoglossus pictus]